MPADKAMIIGPRGYRAAFVSGENVERRAEIVRTQLATQSSRRSNMYHEPEAVGARRRVEAARRMPDRWNVMVVYTSATQTLLKRELM